MRSLQWQWVVVAGALGLAGCGTSNSGGNGKNAPTADITIQNFAYSPQNLTVVPGQVVRVRNLDSMPHSVTSESSAGAFTPGAVSGVQFDTGLFNGTATFTIPTNAPLGTVVPYYCTLHTRTMRSGGQVTVSKPPVYP